VLYVYLGVNASPLGFFCTLPIPHLGAVSSCDDAEKTKAQGRDERRWEMSADDFTQRMTERIFGIWAWRTTALVSGALVGAAAAAYIALNGMSHSLAAIPLLLPLALSSLFKYLDARERGGSGLFGTSVCFTNIFFLAFWLWTQVQVSGPTLVRGRDSLMVFTRTCHVRAEGFGFRIKGFGDMYSVQISVTPTDERTARASPIPYKFRAGGWWIVAADPRAARQRGARHAGSDGSLVMGLTSQ